MYLFTCIGICVHSGSIRPYYTTLYTYSSAVFYSCLQFLLEVTCLVQNVSDNFDRSAYSPDTSIALWVRSYNLLLAALFEETLYLHKFF
jgi:hypothetical protein